MSPSRPLPPSSQPSRGRRVLVTTVWVTAIVLVAAFGALQFLDFSGRGPHTSPGGTPLVTVLNTSSGSPECGSENRTWAADCEYRFVVSFGTTATLENLDFAIESSTGVLLNEPFLVSAADGSGCALGSYNSTVNSWGNATGQSPCPIPDAADVHLASVSTVVLTAANSYPLPEPASGGRLVFVGVGNFAGQVPANLGS